MTKNIKFIAPLTLVAFATLASCGGQTVKSIRLKRVTYSNTVEHAKDILGVMEASKANQAEYNATKAYISDPFAKSVDHYNLFEKGTVTSNIGFDLSGSVKVYMQDINPIELDGIGIGATDTFSTSWDLKEGYVKFFDAKGNSNYVLKKGEQYWRYINYPVDGKKYKVDITDYIDEYFNGSLANFVMVESASNAGIFVEDIDVQESKYIPFSGAGFDMSGFGLGVTFGEEMTEYPTYTNYLSFGDYLTFDVGQMTKRVNGTVLELIDAVAPLVDYVLDVLKLDGVSLTHKYTKNDVNTACSFDLGLNFDLSYIEDIMRIVASFVKIDKLDFDLTASGDLGLDYFLSFENNFVRQQELAFDAKDVNFTLNTYESTMVGKFQNIMVDISAANLAVVMNENVEKDKCTIDTVNDEDYKLFEAK